MQKIKEYEELKRELDNQKMKFINKVKNLIPVSLRSKFVSIVLTIIGIFFELLGIGLVFP